MAASLHPIRQDLEARLAERDELVSSKRTMLATVSVKPRPVRVLPRGNWMDDSGTIVDPGVPAHLPQIPNRTGQRLTRLDLADWLVSPENPLPARVFVNRLWRQFFGTGLSKVLDDLGSQGEWPSHPELLDWLAAEFLESGWDIKHMVRVIVTSETYKQSSLPHADPRAVEMDPFNRLLTRQSRHRLDAEVIRDHTLAVGGLLVREIGGASVKPYQPAGYWDNLYFPKRTYQADDGANQWRRGLYTHWQRQFLHPAMLAFDAPPREECTAERPRSNTPLAALVMLNDPTQFEAAIQLALKITRNPRPLQARLASLGPRVLSRPLTTEELRVLARLYAKHLSDYTEDAESIQSLLTTRQFRDRPELASAELAAFTSVVRAVFNLHETITRN